VLFVINDMARSVNNEDDGQNKNRKNASILKQFLFQGNTNLFKVCHFAFHMFRATSHSQAFLLDTLSLMHHFLNMVDEHSRGKVITVRRKKGERAAATGKKQKRRREDSEEEE